MAASRLDPTVRLDDLIEGITKAHEQPLEQLANAVLLADHLGEVADHLIGHFVDQARMSGASWTEIGRSMGVTKQAAQKRFVPQAQGRGTADHGFERFTQSARNALIVAHNVARSTGHTLVRPEHVVLGALDAPDGLAARAVVAQGLSVDGVRQAVRAQLPPGEGDAPELAPYQAQTKKVLELAVRHSLRLGHDTVGTGHVLLALLELEPGDGPLSTSGVDRARAEEFTVATTAAGDVEE
jgi:Clp amino terminal domain, pathogenicity island component